MAEAVGSEADSSMQTTQEPTEAGKMAAPQPSDKITTSDLTSEGDHLPESAECSTQSTKADEMSADANEDDERHLLRIPPELRCNIYEEDFASIEFARQNGVLRIITPPLLNTCHLIREEMGPLYAGHLKELYKGSWNNALHGLHDLMDLEKKQRRNIANGPQFAPLAFLRQSMLRNSRKNMNKLMEGFVEYLDAIIQELAVLSGKVGGEPRVEKILLSMQEMRKTIWDVYREVMAGKL